MSSAQRSSSDRGPHVRVNSGLPPNTTVRGPRAQENRRARSLSRRDPSGEPIELARASVCAATTRVRYDVLFAEWSAWASDRGVNVLSLVSEPPAYDELLAEFLQVLYQDGAPKGDAGGVLSAVQDKSPRLKKQLPMSQRTVRAWDSLEPNELRTPWPVGLLQAVCTIAFLTGHLDDAMAFYLAFHCLLRPGEFTILTHKLLTLPSIALMGMAHIGVVNVELPKTRRCGPKKQHVLVDDSMLLACLRRFLAGKPSGPRFIPVVRVAPDPLAGLSAATGA